MMKCFVFELNGHEYPSSMILQHDKNERTEIKGD